MHGQAGAVDFERRLAAAEFDATVVHAAVDGPGEGHHEVAGELIDSGDGVGALPLHAVKAAHGGGGLGGGLLHVPLDDINPVREQVRKDAAAEIPIPAPPE